MTTDTYEMNEIEIKSRGEIQMIQIHCYYTLTIRGSLSQSGIVETELTPFEPKEIAFF